MILQALVNYYDTFSSREGLPQKGWSLARAAFVLNISLSGELLNVIPLKQADSSGEKTVWSSPVLKVPEQSIRTVGIHPNFLCDHSGYLLGFDQKGNPQRSQSCFAASKNHHLAVLAEVKSPAAQAIKAFFNNFNPHTAALHPAIRPYAEELFLGENIVFSIDGGPYAHEDKAVCRAWESYLLSQSDSQRTGRCLVTGEMGPIARLHPMIKGVPHAQSSGASLVSFNAPAYESYGKEQGFNAPISESAAFRYGAALNHLLKDSAHRITIGNTTIVYWAEKAEEPYRDIFSLSFNPKPNMDQALASVFQNAATGKPLDWNGRILDPDASFYILGISPNAARLSIRFFLQNSFGTILQRLKKHYDNMKIIHAPYEPEFISPAALLDETVNQNIREKSPSPLLGNALIRSILLGNPYPQALLSGILLRARMEHGINYPKAAGIKACLLQSSRGTIVKEASNMLNEESNSVPYILGRAFSILEQIQQTANPGINATIKERYFSSACMTPASVFPILNRLESSHLKKLEPYQRTYFEKQYGELMNKIEMNGHPIPFRLNLEEQGIFLLGYYHQTQKRYQKKEEK